MTFNLTIATQNLPYNFTNVGRDQITDKLFHVVVDGSAFLYSGNNGREVVISQYHLYTGIKEIISLYIVCHAMGVKNCYF
jgi:hypothetical protein